MLIEYNPGIGVFLNLPMSFFQLLNFDLTSCQIFWVRVLPASEEINDTQHFQKILL